MSTQQLQPGLSVVVPVYNSEQTIAPLVESLSEVLLGCADDFEVILVNDGSRDESWNVIQSLSQQYAWVRGFRLMRNFGQHNALLCGIRHAQYDTTITMDDDLQHPPTEIPKLLEQLSQGFDVVYGRPASMQHSTIRRWLSKSIKTAVAYSTGTSHIQYVSAFRAFRTHLRLAFHDFKAPHFFLDYLLGWGTSRFMYINVEHKPRAVGKSTYSLRRLISHTLVWMTAYGAAPLRMMTISGIGLSGFGFAILAYVLVTYFVVGSLPGFTFLAAMISIFSGMQMLMLGVMGEYLSRIYGSEMRQPTYVVHETSQYETPSVSEGVLS